MRRVLEDLGDLEVREPLRNARELVNSLLRDVRSGWLTPERAELKLTRALAAVEQAERAETGELRFRPTAIPVGTIVRFVPRSPLVVIDGGRT